MSREEKTRTFVAATAEAPTTSILVPMLKATFRVQFRFIASTQSEREKEKEKGDIGRNLGGKDINHGAG